MKPSRSDREPDRNFRWPVFGLLVFAAVATACGRSSEEESRPLRKPLPAPQLMALPDSAFKVTWGLVKQPDRLKAGETARFEVTFTNASDQVWPDVPRAADPATGAGAVRLSYRVRRPQDGSVTRNYLNRADLSAPLSPGAVTTLPFDVELPGEPGTYEVQFDLVQEQVAWFETKGADTNFIQIVVARPN